MTLWLCTGSTDDDVAVANVRDEHEVEIDEPEWSPIGTDTAPWPSEYLLVGCAGCQVEVITQAMEKGRIEEDDISVEAHFETGKAGPEIEGYPDHLPRHYETIVLEITLETTETNEAKVKRLLDIAEDACIVSRSVENGIDVEITKELSVRATAPGSVDAETNCARDAFSADSGSAGRCMSATDR